MAEQDRTVFPQIVRGADLERRAVLYARVSLLHHGQDPKCSPEKFANTANGADGRSWANTWTRGFPAQKNDVRNWIG